MPAISLSEVQFNNIRLHRLHTAQGKVVPGCGKTASTGLLDEPLWTQFVCSQVFVLAQLAADVFQENPTAFLTVRYPACLFLQSTCMTWLCCLT